MVETGFIVAGVSIITIVLTKFEFYVKMVIFRAHVDSWTNHWSMKMKWNSSISN